MGRANVGFEEEDWRFILWLSKEMGMTISETVRDCVTSARKECEQGAFDEGEKYPWNVKDKGHD